MGDGSVVLACDVGHITDPHPQQLVEAAARLIRGVGRFGS